MGERLKFARELRDLGSNQLNKLAGLSNSYVSSVETGRRKDLEAGPIDALAKALHVRFDWLWNGLEPMEGPSPGRAEKPNLERAVQKNPERWIPHVLIAARAFKRDRPIGEWETVLDRLQAGIAPIVSQNDH